MPLITCKECGNEVSSEAKACPKCGARVKRRSLAWLWVLIVPLGIFVVFAIIGGNDPKIQTMGHDRRVYEQCMKEFNDELLDRNARQTIIAPVCLRMREEFRRKYGREP
jgi:hypothetical protein